MPNEWSPQESKPYIFQEFPKTLYNKAGLQRTVNSREEQDAAGKEWSETAVKPPAATTETKDRNAELLEAIADLRRETGEAILALTARVDALEAEPEGEADAPHRGRPRKA